MKPHEFLQAPVQVPLKQNELLLAVCTCTTQNNGLIYGRRDNHNGTRQPRQKKISCVYLLPARYLVVHVQRALHSTAVLVDIYGTNGSHQFTEAPCLGRTTTGAFIKLVIKKNRL